MPRKVKFPFYKKISRRHGKEADLVPVLHAGRRKPRPRLASNKQIHKYNLMVRHPVSLSAGVAGMVNMAWTFACNFPTYGRVSTGYGQYPQAVADYATLFGLYDEYKVDAIRVSFYPNSSVSMSPSSLSINVDEPFYIYMYKDEDDEALPTLESQVLNKGIMPHSFVPGKTISKTYKINGKWINTSLIGTAPGTAITSNTELGNNAYASIKTFMNLYRGASDQYYGRFIVTWVVSFRGLKDA